MIAGGVQRDGLGAGRDAEVDLGAGGGDDCAVADDPRVGQGLRVGRAGGRVRVLAGCVGRERYGLPRSAGTLSPTASRPASRRRGLIRELFEGYLDDLVETFFGTCVALLFRFLPSRDPESAMQFQVVSRTRPV